MVVTEIDCCILGLFRGYIELMEKKMETTILYYIILYYIILYYIYIVILYVSRAPPVRNLPVVPSPGMPMRTCQRTQVASPNASALWKPQALIEIGAGKTII